MNGAARRPYRLHGDADIVRGTRRLSKCMCVHRVAVWDYEYCVVFMALDVTSMFTGYEKI
jgi:hypothetical protein